MSLVDAIPVVWGQSLYKKNGYLSKTPSVIQDHIQFVLDNQGVLITEVNFKKVYREIVSELVAPPMAQSK